jgi:hypothetical protein
MERNKKLFYSNFFVVSYFFTVSFKKYGFDPGSEISDPEKTNPGSTDPGVQKSTGLRIPIRNTAAYHV